MLKNKSPTFKCSKRKKTSIQINKFAMENHLNCEFYWHIFLNLLHILFTTMGFSFSFPFIYLFLIFSFLLCFFCFLILCVFVFFFFSNKKILIHIQLCGQVNDKNFFTLSISRNKATFLVDLESTIIFCISALKQATSSGIGF